MSQTDKRANTQLAFQVAAEHLGIPVRSDISSGMPSGSDDRSLIATSGS